MCPMNRPRRDPRSFLPLSAHDFHVLLLLAEAPLHGYGIVKASEGSPGPALELGSLYRMLHRLKREGLVEETSVPQTGSQRKRRYYRTTALGRLVARAEVRRLQKLLAGSSALRLLEER